MGKKDSSHPKGDILDEGVKIPYLGRNNMFQEGGVHVTDRFEEPREQKVSIGWLPGRGRGELLLLSLDQRRVAMASKY